LTPTPGTEADVAQTQRSMHPPKCGPCRSIGGRCIFQPGAEKCDYCSKAPRICRSSTKEDDDAYETKLLDAQLRRQARREKK
jgi:hypothetical protein